MFRYSLPRSVCLTVGISLVGACATTAAHKPGEEYLAKIDVVGNKQVKDKDLTEGLALQRVQKRGRAPDPYQVSVDQDRIKGEYVRRGFLDADVRSRVERKGDAATVIYTVDEGVRAKTKVEVYGIDEPALVAEVKKTLTLKDGDYFDYAKYDLSKEALRGVALDAGYAHTTLTPTVYADRATNVAIVGLDYDLGKKATFGGVTIEGVDGDLKDAVEDRLYFHPGQQYSSRAIAQTSHALYGLNRFSTVRVSPDLDSGGETVAMKVSVAQSAQHEVKLGGGFGADPTAYEVRGRAGYSITAWPFALDTVSVDLRPAYAYLRDGSGYEPRVRALAKLERQDLLWTYSTGTIEGGYDYLTYEAYTSYGPRARLGFSTPIISQRLNVQVGWGIQEAQFSKINALIDDTLQQQIGIDHPERVAAFTQALVLDLRDNLIEPTKGFYAEGRIAEGGAYAGGSYNYYSVVPELRGYVPLGPVVIAARARTGGIFGDIPPTERFFSGGSSTQRGFSERKLAPSAVGMGQSIPYGGGGLVETGLEARIPITTVRKMPVGAVTFLDGGDVTETYSDLNYGNLHWAAGVGLRVKTIIGPARLDVGWRLNRTGGMNPDPESKWAFHLGIGEAF
ncbi:MAG TPA: BamA/TamA family outer membrane protein [Kofleriaceae bacterium]|jgi:outer membrane protein assembly factor BamA